MIALVGLGGALLGALIGASTMWLVEWRREDRQRRIAQAAVVLELALLSSALKTAALVRELRRDQLDRPYWQRFGPELIVSLPDYLVKAMHLLLEDGFDSLKQAYGFLRQGMHPAYWPAAQVLFISWAYHADRIIEMIGEYRRTKKVTLSVDEPNKDMLLRVIEDAQRYAIDKVRSHGLDPTIRLSVPVDADLSLPPDQQPRNDRRVEFMPDMSDGGTPEGAQAVTETADRRDEKGA
jgi:hypothetical protein